MLTLVAVGGSLLYGASLALVLTGWNAAASALWLALSAGLAWFVLIPALCWVGRVRLAPCIDACLVTMACGEIVLGIGALINTAAWWSRAALNGVQINFAIVGLSNVIMALVLARRLRAYGMSPGRVWAIWMVALNGSGAAFFLIFHQWLHPV